MNYLFSDFYLLVGVASKETRTVGDAYRRMSELMGSPATTDCLLYALRGLATGGWITVQPTNGVISVTTSVTATDAGKKAAAVSGLQKLLGEQKAFNRNEVHFCALARPEESVGAEWTVEAEGFATIADDMMRARMVSRPLFTLTEEGEGTLTLTLHHPAEGYTPDESEDGDEGEEDSIPETSPSCMDASLFGEVADEAPRIDSVSVCGDTARIFAGVTHLLETAHALLTQPSKARKVALHGADRSFIITLAYAASESGYLALRMTVEPIRFNRQRFYGKRDGELDYAQCGLPAITHEMNRPAEFAALLLPAVVASPARLSEADQQILTEIHRILKR